MRTILLILFTIPIGTISWFDLGTLLGTIALIVYIYRFARAMVTKKDMDSALKKKAGVTMVESEFKLVEQKIKSVTDMSKMQDKYLKETLEEQHAILDTIQEDIKSILTKL